VDVVLRLGGATNDGGSGGCKLVVRALEKY